MRTKSDSLSDIGRHRQRNEDACYSNQQQGLFIIADGMGGHPAGNVASRLAVESLREYLESKASPEWRNDVPEQLQLALQHCHATVKNAGDSNLLWRRMGTTVAVLLIVKQMAFVANIGDSRIYLWRNHALRQCSKDDNPTDPSLFAGNLQGLSSLLTQAVGLETPPVAHQQKFRLQPADRLLLCTDGLSNLLTDDAIAQLLAEQQPTAQTCRKLVAAANDKGGYDNISVILVEMIE